MRILIENNEYALVNKGDIAMLQVTVERLRERWPHAQIGVVTTAPDRLRHYAPGSVPVLPDGDDQWGDPRTGLAARARAAVPARVSVEATDLARALERQLRRLGRPVKRALVAHVPRSHAPPPPTRDAAPPHRPLTQAVDRADAVVALGGGYITDSVKRWALPVLAELGHAVEHGRPAVMFGQGIGPIRDPELRERASQVLPRVGLICLREGREGPVVLRELGVRPDRVLVTGDDAIDLARRLTPSRLGDSLGVSMRLAPYLGFGEAELREVRAGLHRVASRRGATLVPVTISEWRNEDREATALVTSGFGSVARRARPAASPLQVAARLSCCRVHVAATYHSAVFALSQGIPVVAMSGSAYYDNKLLGLQGQFGEGCAVIETAGGALAARVESAVDEAWEDAPRLRASLLEAADRQIKASRDAYGRAMDLIEASMGGTGD